jgi:hypothetical protein
MKKSDGVATSPTPSMNPNDADMKDRQENNVINSEILT